MNYTPLYYALRQLVADHRLTGITADVMIDGVPLLTPGDDVVDLVDPELTWNEDGGSVQLSEWGGQLLKPVEDLRRAWLDGTPAQRRAAQLLPQYFVRLSEADRFTPKQNFTARENANFRYMIRGMAGFRTNTITSMTEYSPRFLVKGTKEPEWRYLPAHEVDHVRGGPNPGAPIPNHRIVVGDWTVEEIVKWAEDWLRDESLGSQHVDF